MTDIAIVGMAGRFPGAGDLDEFWANIRDGVESISFFNDDELTAAGVPEAELRAPTYVRAGSCLPGIDLFDADFFGYTAREAEVMDPQHRLFLETSWTALEHAGHDPAQFAGRIGVYGGAGANGYLGNVYTNPAVVAAVGRTQVLLGNELGFLSTRVSYKLDLRGPSISLRTACSTALVALHLACRDLRDGGCDMALAGAAYVNLEQALGYRHQDGSFLSPDGHCRPFDAAARGTVFGSGVGLVVLRRLDDAIADGDAVYAVVRGSAVNNDGAVKVGFTAPSVRGQADVMTAALQDAGVSPDSVDYIEAHGTGTVLGDPIELRAIAKTYGGVLRDFPASLGSLKSNIGHLDAAAGIAGVLKTVLALQARTLPPTLNFETPNPDFDFGTIPFQVQRSGAPWPRGDRPRRAAVSAFGFGGTNAHVVLEEAPAPAPVAESSRPSQLVILSARTPQVLEELTGRFATHLRQENPALSDVAYTAARGRHAFPHRRVVTGADAAAVAKALESGDPACLLTGHTTAEQPPVAFLFAGQGSQHAGMARELYAREPVFRSTVDECLAALGENTDLLGLLLGDPADLADTDGAGRMARTVHAQPALFVLEYALARLWQSWGVAPHALIGHSLGEYVAACLAGVFTVTDAVQLVALRGRLMQRCPAGAMLSVVADRDTVTVLLPDELSLAAHNGPRDCVVAGASEAVAAFQETLAARGLTTQRVATSHAFHSALMAPMVEEFVAAVAAVGRRAPSLPFVSNVTGTWITDEEAVDPAYWGRHVLATVEFARGVRTLAENSATLMLEVGPGQTLSSLTRRVLAGAGARLVTSSMPHRQDKRDPVEGLQRALGQLWLAGVVPDWAEYYRHERRQRVALPTYPFERKRFWLDPGPGAAGGTTGPQQDIEDWFSVPSWQRTPAPPAAAPSGDAHWLVFVEPGGLGAALAHALRATGAIVSTVEAGGGWSIVERQRYAIDPGNRAHYTDLLSALSGGPGLPTRVVHCWTVGTANTDPDSVLRLGFGSLINLTQALNRHPDPAPRAIWVISSGLHDVVGGEWLCPPRATVLGPCRVIPREHPGLAVRSVDVVVDGAQEVIVECLLREFTVEPEHAAIAYRGGRRWSQVYVPAPLGPVDNACPTWREDGVYLITGGTGGLGLALASHLARAGAKVVLTARTPVPPEREWSRFLDSRPDDGRTSTVVRELVALGALGADPLVVTGDIADPEHARAVVAQAVARFGRLDGVFHAAGVAGGGLVQLKSDEVATEVLRPKVHGTLALEAALDGRTLDFVVLFGSNAANVGDFGLVDYCAANAFLDAYAQASTSRRVMAVDWGPWQDVGMAVDAELPDMLALARRQDVAERGMPPARALEALDRIMRFRPGPQVVVSPVKLDVLLANAFTLSHDDDRLVNLPGAATHARPEIATSYVPPRGGTQRRLCGAWQELLGIDRVGVDDNFFDLGGSSLIAIQLVATINRTLGSNLTVTQVYEALTVARLSLLIDGVEDTSTAPALPPDDLKNRVSLRRQHQQARMLKGRARRR